MIGLGARLAVAGGRRSVLALVLTASAVAAGTAMLLLALTVEPAYAARSARSEIAVGQGTSLGTTDARPPRYTAVRTSNDAFRNRTIDVIDMAGVGVDPPHPADLALPAPGEVLVSPALAELAAREPLLADRYPPGLRLLPDTLVPSPDSLLAVRGAAAPAATDGAWATVQAFQAGTQSADLGPVLRLLLVIGAIAMLAPIVIFVATATRLTAASRERRMAALRLAGASTTQVARLAGVDALLTGVTGAVAGLALFFLVRPLAAYVTVDDRWYAADLLPTPLGFVTALVGVPLAALLGSQLALARVAISPLGVGRRARPLPLRAWRLLPLLVAVPLFAFLVLGTWGTAGSAGNLGLGGSFALVLGSLLLAGPWLARMLGAALARSGSAAAMLAGRRLTTDPRAGFRAVAGAVVGTFVAAMFFTVLPAAQTEVDPAAVSGLAADAAVGHDGDEAEAAAAARVLGEVRGVTPILVRMAYLPGSGGSVWIGDCAAIARLTANDPTRCAPGRILVAPADAGISSVRSYTGSTMPLRGEAVVALAPGAGYDRPSAIVPTDAVADLSGQARIGIIADPDTLERARTALSAAGVPVELSTAALRTAAAGGRSTTLGRVLIGVMIGTFVVAGCSAAVAAATGLLERRRSFALLRLTGTPLGVLRRAALLELVVPLVVTSVAAALLGVLTGRLIGFGGGADEPVPWSALGGPLAVGLVVALALGSLALPLVRRVSEGDGTRFG